MRDRLLAAVTAACLAAGVLVPAGRAQTQTPAPATAARPTGLILGRVIDGNSGSPVTGALVRIVPRVAAGAGTPGFQADPVMTAGDGRFLFRSLPKGRYGLLVSKAGYMAGAYGRRSFASVADQTIEIDDGARVSDAEIKIWPFATLSGRVVDEAGEPLVNATVKACLRAVQAGRLMLDFATPTGSAYTDDRGIYRHTNLQPGDYIVIVASGSATIPASVQDDFDRLQRGGAEASMAQAVSMSSAVAPSISGMRAGDFIVSFGRTQMGFDGVYRRPGPGELPVDGDGRLPVYRTTFYPGVPTLSAATPVTLRSGEERTGVDFQLRPVNSVRVTGTVVGPDGPAANLGLRLTPAASKEFMTDTGMMNSVTITDARGAFTFLGIPPGQYEVRALRRPPAPPGPPSGPNTPPPQVPSDATLWGVTPISVGDQPVDGVQVTLAPGFRLSGRIVFEGAARRPAPERTPWIRVDLEPADGRFSLPYGVLGQNTPVLGRVDEADQFRTYGVPPGRYVLTVFALPAPWSLKSIAARGRDVTATSLEITDSNIDDVVITLTDRPTLIQGSVRGADGRIDTGASVIVFPQDPAARVDVGASPRSVRTARVGRDGAFTLTGLPAGDYLAAAISDEAMAGWNEAKALEALAGRATRVHVEYGATVRVDLQTIRNR